MLKDEHSPLQDSDLRPEKYSGKNLKLNGPCQIKNHPIKIKIACYPYKAFFIKNIILPSLPVRLCLEHLNAVPLMSLTEAVPLNCLKVIQLFLLYFEILLLRIPDNAPLT